MDEKGYTTASQIKHLQAISCLLLASRKLRSILGANVKYGEHVTNELRTLHDGFYANVNYFIMWEWGFMDV